MKMVGSANQELLSRYGHHYSIHVRERKKSISCKIAGIKCCALLENEKVEVIKCCGNEIFVRSGYHSHIKVDIFLVKGVNLAVKV